ncbi:MAG: PEP/pyruvate-binding domain-containing protein, partial [Candidatus Methanomethylicaceae archaeon]
MKKLGLPIPPGIIITTEAWKEYCRSKTLSEDLKTEIAEKLKAVEKESGKVFGGRSNPLLVSVRSGAPVSMPGMMDTILNLGLNDVTVIGLTEQTNDEKFAYNCYWRFVNAFSRIVLNVGEDRLKGILENYMRKLCFKTEAELDVNALREIVREHKALVEEETGKKFPDDVYDQLFSAVRAVFDSWFSQRAITYRQ